MTDQPSGVVASGRRPPLQTSYFLVDFGKGMPRWCTLFQDGDDFFWIDFKGTRTARASGQPLAHVEGANEYVTIAGVPDHVVRLERALASRHLLDPWSDQGWISPEGRFYGCAFFAHDALAAALLRRTAATLEHQGWVRVHADSFRSSERRPNRRQMETLLALGFPDDELGDGRRRRFEVDRTAPPPRYAVKPSAPEAAAVLSQQASVPPAETSSIRPGGDLDRLTERLAGIPRLAPLFERPPELVPDVGPGIWRWMLQFEDLAIGGEDDVADLAAAPGLHLHKTSFDTLELSVWPFDGLHLDQDAAELLDRRPGGAGPIRSPV